MNMFSYHFPFRPRVRLTSFCNQKCKYCFAVDYLSSQEQNKEIPLTNLEDILIMCKNEGIKYIAWQGGEPLLHSKLHDIIQLHKKYCIKAMIFTNGIFESEIIKQLEPIVHSVLVNCNAPDTYSRKDLDTIYRNVSLMKELFGDNRVAIGINIYSEDLDTRYILGYAHDMNVKEVRVDITRPAPSHTNSFIDFNKVSIMFHKAYSTVKMLYDNGIIKVHFDCPFPLCLLSDDEMRTPPQQCSLTADDGASLPLEWCMATGGVVHRAAMLRTTRGCPCVCAWIHPQSGWYRRCR